MKKEYYLSILQQNITASAKKLGLGGNWMFQQDNDSKHSSQIVKECLLYRTPKVLGHRSQSPDLNPIEHLWEYVHKKFKEFKYFLQKRREQDERTKIPSEFPKKLVESMPRRLEVVIESKGRQTKY